MSDPRPRGRAKAWIHAARVPTLAAAVVPVLVGTGLALRDHAFRPGPAMAALLGAIMIQVGTNLVNDLGDLARGADTEERLGPKRALQMGWLTAAEVRAGAIACFAIAFLAGLYLTAVAGWPVVLIGIASVAAGIGYTAGPWPLAYNGLGEAFVFLFFGVVAVCGTYFVQAGTIHPQTLVASVPVGALATAILLVNNVRDEATDRMTGKRTLAVRLGRAGGRGLYRTVIFLAYLAPFSLATSGRSAWALLPILTLPLALAEIRRVLLHDDGPTLNRALRGTARLHALFGLLLAFGIAVS